MAQNFQDFFFELLYGSGSWFGVVLLLAFIIGLLTRWKYSGVLLLPVTIFLAIDYLKNDLAWQSIIMFVSSVFIIVYMAKK